MLGWVGWKSLGPEEWNTEIATKRLSKSAVVSCGRSWKGQKLWFTRKSFDCLSLHHAVSGQDTLSLQSVSFVNHLDLFISIFSLFIHPSISAWVREVNVFISYLCDLSFTPLTLLALPARSPFSCTLWNLLFRPAPALSKDALLL